MVGSESAWRVRAKQRVHMLTVLTVNNTVKIQLYVGLIQGSTMSLGGAICLHADCSFSTYFIVQNEKGDTI